ncbi:protein-glutamine gamma-glutamyltransferase K-like [Mytilus galloprovincialis]|uniref:protein-glutamine gamma-glutamyltransferase K-like n=1 Tax=Mytilus galloprovincialis TaxID=29158 RepID=UPI003F7B4DBD
MPRRRSTTEGNASTTPKKRRYNLRDTAARRRRNLAENPEGRTNTITDEEFRNKLSNLKEKKEPGKALSVSKVDTLTYENRKAHNTYDYDQEDVILRRGQEFKVDVEFDRDIDVEYDNVTLQFVFGSRPKESKGSIIRIPLNLNSTVISTDIGKCWKIVTEKQESKAVRCVITTPPDACIGDYELFVETKLKDGKESSRHKFDGRIIILFNPWCKDDSVYMDDPSFREEYVMNDSGRIWVGSKWRNYGRAWNFGQFDEPALDAVFYLLDKAELSDEARNSPVSIIRTISSFVNSLDNDGMLEGRWTADYPEDCTKPTAWTGSVAIIKQYMETKEPVQFGQCWVFSGLTTTLCRAIGIPTRSVTNFQSAHDTDCSMTIDRHYDAEGEPLEYLDDSVWNFHVWNDSWFKRYDLPDGYDGWQAHDGTPQETSEGVMRCGPAPLRAIKDGHVYLNYDVGFVFSEVNGDRIVWEVNEDKGTMEVMQIDRHSVGWNISTKAVGSDLVELLDEQYKHWEYSDEERRVVKFVNRFSTRRQENIYNLDTKKEIDFNIILPHNAMVGEDFSVYAMVKNVADEKRDIIVKSTLVNSFYTGLPGKRVKTMKFTETLDAGEEKKIVLPVTYKEYGPTMNPEARFQIFITGKNVATGRMHAIEESFVLNKPEIIIEVPEEVEYGEETEATLTFTNTTGFKLTQCAFYVESPGCLEAVKLEHTRTLLPGKDWSETVKLKPRRKYRSRREVVVEFTSNEIVGMEGNCRFKVVNLIK